MFMLTGPGHAQVRDLYWTFRNFRNRVVDFLRYRRVTANMDERFPVSLHLHAHVLTSLCLGKRARICLSAG